MSEKLLLLAIFVVSMLLMAGNHRKKRKKIVFFGDSLTNFGSRPGGYIPRILRMLKDTDIEYNFELVGAGVNGNTVSDLYRRMDRDILSKGADIVVIFIGINDIWHKVTGGGTDREKFETVYEAIIEKLESVAIKAVLCTPTVIGEKLHYTNEQDADVELYSEIVRNLALKYDLPLVDLRKAFFDYINANNVENAEYNILTYDRVHLNNNGNQLVAEEMWKVLQQIK
ncbi:SGNH/GDSL hydrolase family protein [Segetibacter koreensis]|uniref:SGNH/GDSL hydrolase family protein n=1 Tax=Segetibacter koreensis TaxID=398037 RepID=UPI00036CF2D9|nr:GDSL-type esterase/lipase family protein [Segetibacter koreensis]